MKANSSLAARLTLTLCVLGLFFLVVRQVLADSTTHQRTTSSQSSTAGGIKNIADFLNQCPNTDPIYAQLRSDITLRRNGVLVGEVPCTEPISQLPGAQYTDELIYLQTLRTIYYMDLGRSGYLPWTSGTLYAWMTSKIGGINLSDAASGSYCCTQIGGKTYIVIKTQDEYNRNFDRQWKGISGNLGLVMHEVRHTDGFPHNSGCGISNGCDAAYDEANLSPYGIQWWLAKNWLMGDIYVGHAILRL